MGFVIKHRGSCRLKASEYLCEVHGRFELDVETVDGDAPDTIPCPFELLDDHFCGDPPALCGKPAIWVVSSPLGRVKRFEVVRGKWEKPERPTYYDTRELGEGMDLHEWREKRRRAWDEKRKADVMRMARDE